MRKTDGASARYWIKEAPLKKIDVDMLTGAIAAACELCTNEAALAAGPQMEGRVFDAVTNNLQGIVATALDRAISMALLPGLALDGEDPHHAPKTDVDSPISMLIHRLAAPYRELAS